MGLPCFVLSIRSGHSQTFAKRDWNDQLFQPRIADDFQKQIDGFGPHQFDILLNPREVIAVHIADLRIVEADNRELLGNLSPQTFGRPGRAYRDLRRESEYGGNIGLLLKPIEHFIVDALFVLEGNVVELGQPIAMLQWKTILLGGAQIAAEAVFGAGSFGFGKRNDPDILVAALRQRIE